MPPHSAIECSHYDPWSHFQRTGIFCGTTTRSSTNGSRTNASMEVDSFEEQAAGVHLPPAPQYPGGMKRFLQKPQRNIVFKEDVDVYEIPNMRELEKSHLAELYMTKEEMAGIHAEAWEHVELMDLGIEYAESNSYSKRGLTDLRGECVERRRRQREQAYKVVFGLQNIHGGTSTSTTAAAAPAAPAAATQPRSYSPQIMADLYGQVSLAAKSHAHKTAMYDAMAIERR